MREDCDGRHSIDMLDDENCRDEDNDDLHKILALSNPFRRIDGEWFFALLLFCPLFTLLFSSAINEIPCVSKW